MSRIARIDVINHLKQMLDALYLNDSSLLKRSLDINERTITNKMGAHLQNILGTEYHVDCEYNRMKVINGEETEYIDVTKKVNLPKEIAKSGNVYPDIIVHNRDNDQSNDIIIEVKIKWKNGKLNNDKQKLLAYKRDLKYKFAFFILLNEKREMVKVEEIEIVNENNFTSHYLGPLRDI